MGNDFGGTLAIWIFAAMIASWLLLNMLVDLGEHHVRRRSTSRPGDSSSGESSQQPY